MTEVDDEDSWLYGDVKSDKSSEKLKQTDNESSKENEESEIQETSNKDSNKENQLDTEKTDTDVTVIASTKTKDDLVENDKVNEIVVTTDTASITIQDEKTEESDDSDDDVQVTIDEITTGNTPTFPQQNAKSFYRNPVPLPVAPKTIVPLKGLDINSQGDINGVPVIDVNIDLLEDKPWRKPGADISDYFNYGFNENSWKIYCEKQRTLRAGGSTISIPATIIKPAIINGTSSIIGTPKLQRQYNPIPQQTFENTVRTISTLQVSRRKDEELQAQTGLIKTETTTSPASQISSPANSSQPNNPTFPLPGIQPGVITRTTLFPNQPPPGIPIGLPPPGFPMGVLPPGMPPIPGLVLPGTNFPPRGFPSVGIMPSHPYFDQNLEGNTSDKLDERHHSDEDGHYRRERSLSSRRDMDRDRDRHRRDYRDKRDRDRDRDRSDRDKLRDRERDRDRDRERSDRGERERGSDRDRSDREKDRERDRDKDRERDKDYERERESRRYREDSPRHKASRRKYDEDDRHGSSKHKKAKKHKHKDKETDLVAPGTEDIINPNDQ